MTEERGGIIKLEGFEGIAICIEDDDGEKNGAWSG